MRNIQRDRLMEIFNAALTADELGDTSTRADPLMADSLMKGKL